MGWPENWTSLDKLADIGEWDEWEDDWERGVQRLARDVLNRVDRLKALGNGQVPLVAAVAWCILTGQDAR
jgi:DNA (cytosine-5)-methyltransferase 1